MKTRILSALFAIGWGAIVFLHHTIFNITISINISNVI